MYIDSIGREIILLTILAGTVPGIGYSTTIVIERTNGGLTGNVTETL